jgi:hypothetical protein
VRARFFFSALAGALFAPDALACGGAAAATAYVASRGWPSWLK